MSFVLVGITSFSAGDKQYNKIVVIDDDTNISEIFIASSQIQEFKQLMYKDIGSKIELHYIRDIKAYKPALKS